MSACLGRGVSEPVGRFLTTAKASPLQLFFLLNVILLLYWGLNRGPCICQKYSLPLCYLTSQVFFPLHFWQSLLYRQALNSHCSPDRLPLWSSCLGLPSSWGLQACRTRFQHRAVSEHFLPSWFECAQMALLHTDPMSPAVILCNSSLSKHLFQLFL